MGGGVLELNTAGSWTMSGAISGTHSSVSKTGAGTVTLNASNSYSGATNVAGGTLQLTNASTIPSGSAHPHGRLHAETGRRAVELELGYWPGQLSQEVRSFLPATKPARRLTPIPPARAGQAAPPAAGTRSTANSAPEHRTSPACPSNGSRPASPSVPNLQRRLDLDRRQRHTPPDPERVEDLHPQPGHSGQYLRIRKPARDTSPFGTSRPTATPPPVRSPSVRSAAAIRPRRRTSAASATPWPPAATTPAPPSPARSSAPALNKQGTGGLTLSGANTYSGGTTLSDGLLYLGGTAGTAVGTGDLTIASGANGNNKGVYLLSDQGSGVIHFNSSSSNCATPTATTGPSPAWTIPPAPSTTALSGTGGYNQNVSAPGTLTLNVATGSTYTYAGIIRNADAGGGGQRTAEPR